MVVWQQFKEILDYSFLNVGLGRIAVAVVVFLFIFAMRQVFSRVVMRILRRIAGRTKFTIDEKLLDVIEPPARMLFIVVGLWAGFQILQLPEDAKELISKLIRSLYVIVVIWAAYRATDLLSDFLRKLSAKTESNLDDQVVMFIGKTLRVLVLIIGLMILVREWGYDIAGLVAGLGLGGLAFALAAKDTVANLFGSVTILMDRPFVVGDWIETPSIEGTVEDIRLRSTQIRTFANALVTVPNSVLANSAITNWSRMNKRRIKYKLGVTYSSKSYQVEECVNRIKKMLEEHPAIHKDVIFVYFTDFGESALDLFLYFFTVTTVWKEYLEVRQDVNLRIMKIVEELGMSIAFPSRSIYIKNTGEGNQGIKDSTGNEEKIG
ncbi:mechanosensitive ion channel family protein [candidate division KSB1 bacterium]